jgi:hypothetical protein
MTESRRIDIWVGRAVAVVGIVYVLLASIWPLAADAADTLLSSGPETARAVERRPLSPPLVDVKVAALLADLVVTQRSSGRRPIALHEAFPFGIIGRPMRADATEPADDDAGEPIGPSSLLAVAGTIGMALVALRDQRLAGRAA